MGNGRAAANLADLQRLQTQLVDRLKEFEFGLRQAAGVEEERKLFQSGGAAVPAGFRDLVEQYYRELSEGRR
ncbi:MAG: hypothetical protein KY464_16380 [Gemmatimonadetes bacterium]|nr:hypothetical protein [Gemmatimonadota bacterium]